MFDWLQVIADFLTYTALMSVVLSLFLSQRLM